MTIQKDVIIFGGGIAGLWLLNRLRNQGLDAILLETSSLGNGQTIASQGMIHGGVKYTLSGNVTGASQSISEMPDLWKACMQGTGDVDLRDTSLLSSRYFMWPRQNLKSRLTAFLGSKALRGKVNTLKPPTYPDFFSGNIDGPLYELTDIVLDVPSLLNSLGSGCHDHIFKIDPDTLQVKRKPSGGIDQLQLQDQSNQTITLQAQRYISTCGEGTEAFLSNFNLPTVPMQRRPLHMVMVRHQHQHPIYVHCVSGQLTATPALTITTHPAENGDCIWYLGGELAESGIEKDRESQIECARNLVKEYFPWCDFSSATWDTFRINRAEPSQDGGKRPDTAFLHEADNLLVCWPTKLTLAPALANDVLAKLNASGLQPKAQNGEPSANPDLPFPGIAATPWSSL